MTHKFKILEKRNNEKINTLRLKDMISAEILAREFHELYESLAPNFGYSTNPDTRIFNTNSSNGKLMIAVCDKILDQLQNLLDKKVKK